MTLDKVVYYKYLDGLKNRIFKILPLCEEKNKHIDTYLENLIIEFKGLPRMYPEVLDTEIAWYVKVSSSLYTFYEDYSIEELHSDEGVKRVKRQVFLMINIIGQEMEMIK